jgi:hypothetical protein
MAQGYKKHTLDTLPVYDDNLVGPRRSAVAEKYVMPAAEPDLLEFLGLGDQPQRRPSLREGITPPRQYIGSGISVPSEMPSGPDIPFEMGQPPQMPTAGPQEVRKPKGFFGKLASGAARVLPYAMAGMRGAAVGSKSTDPFEAFTRAAEFERGRQREEAMLPFEIEKQRLDIQKTHGDLLKQRADISKTEQERLGMEQEQTYYPDTQQAAIENRIADTAGKIIEAKSKEQEMVRKRVEDRWTDDDRRAKQGVFRREDREAQLREDSINELMRLEGLRYEDARNVVDVKMADRARAKADNARADLYEKQIGVVQQDADSRTANASANSVRAQNGGTARVVDPRLLIASQASIQDDMQQALIDVQKTYNPHGRSMEELDPAIQKQLIDEREQIVQRFSSLYQELEALKQQSGSGGLTGAPTSPVGGGMGGPDHSIIRYRLGLGQ